MVIGAINGQFAPVFDKLTKLQLKNSFALAIVVGDVFADPSVASKDNDSALAALLEGKFNVPLPTYFTFGQHSLPQSVVDRLEASDGEVCTNLYFLGKRSTTKTPEGIKIVALGGSLDFDVAAGLSKDRYLPFHTEGDAKALHGANTADILITSYWPAAVRTGSKVVLADNNQDPPTEQCISNLCATLKPRYHFSHSASVFYEREPFFHPAADSSDPAKPITRFISLSSFGNQSGAKSLYAFTLDPKASPPATIPPNATASPFTSINKKRPLPDQQTTHSHFRFSDSGDQSQRQHNSKRTRTRPPPPTPRECFFCLSNPSLATHLIVSIGSECYLTTAKGPLPTRATYASLESNPFPFHILIIPLSHAPTIRAIDDPTTRTSTFTEMARYRKALQTMVSSLSNDELGAVTWEVSREKGVHVHWQFLPVSGNMVKKGLVEAAFRVEAENEKYPTLENVDHKDGADDIEGDYFRVWIWRPATSEDGSEEAQDSTRPQSVGKEMTLILPLSYSFRFDMQFGRRVMAKLLGLEGRADWKACGQSETEEKEDAEGFKKTFGEGGWDFSLNEED